MLYLDNLEASNVVLRKLSDEWKECSVKDTTFDHLKETLKSFRQKVIYFGHSGKELFTQRQYRSSVYHEIFWIPTYNLLMDSTKYIPIFFFF